MTTSRKQTLLWEAGWISVEMAGIGVGLWFGLGMGNWTIASVLMSSVCGLSFLVRVRHYGALDQVTTGHAMADGASD